MSVQGLRVFQILEERGWRIDVDVLTYLDSKRLAHNFLIEAHYSVGSLMEPGILFHKCGAFRVCNAQRLVRFCLDGVAFFVIMIVVRCQCITCISPSFWSFLDL